MFRCQWGLSQISWLAAHGGAESAIFMAEKGDKLPHLRSRSHPHPPLHLRTHLPLLLIEGVGVDIQRGGYSVSYTHLDVYKRQAVKETNVGPGRAYRCLFSEEELRKKYAGE